LVDGIKVRIRDFSFVSFIHIKRELYEAAYILAKSCFIVTSSEVFHSVPDCIRGTICIILIDQ
jgi:hypothetical protein